MSESYVRQDFDFFGQPLAILSKSAEDIEHFRYYFTHQISDRNDKAHAFLLLHDGTERGFVNSLLSPDSKKEIWERKSDDGSWQLYDSFSARSNMPSPIPPFTMPRLNKKFVVFHAAAISFSGGEASLFTGPSFSGKSVLTLSLVNAGAKFLSDDLAVYNIKTSKIEPFSRPIGIRENTLNLLPWLSEKVRMAENSGKEFELNSATTKMIRVDDLFPESISKTVPLRRIYWLSNDPKSIDISVERINADPIAAITQSFFRQELIKNDISQEGLAKILSSVEIFSLTYDLEKHVNELTKRILTLESHGNA